METFLLTGCLDAFMIWVAPVCVGASTLIYGLVCLFLDDNDAHTFSPKGLGAFFFLLLAVGWVAASLAVAGSGVSSAFFAFALAGLIALCFLVVGVFGVKGLNEKLEQSEEIQETIAGFRPYATGLQGLFLVTCGPVILLYLFLSFVNQLVRQALNCCTYSVRALSLSCQTPTDSPRLLGRGSFSAAHQPHPNPTPSAQSVSTTKHASAG